MEKESGKVVGFCDFDLILIAGGMGDRYIRWVVIIILYIIMEIEMGAEGGWDGMGRWLATSYRYAPAPSLYCGGCG